MQCYTYPEERCASRILPVVIGHFPNQVIKPARGTELQNSFAVFNLFDDGIRIAKLRIRVSSELKLFDNGMLDFDDIEMIADDDRFDCN
jgi:hypothetical protein